MKTATYPHSPGDHFCAILVLMVLILSACWGVGAEQRRSRRIASPGAAPAGLTSSDWSGILQQINPPAQQAYLKASNAEAGDDFGMSVAVSGDTLVIGAPFEDGNTTEVNGNQSDNSLSNSGAAYIFVRNGTNWSQQAYLKASNTESNDQFGYSVSVSGDTVVVGAPYEASNATGVNGEQNDNSATNSGAAYVFVRSGTNWTQQAYLKASNTGAGDEFGFSVSVSGDTIVVGAFFEASAATGVDGNQEDNIATNSGAAYVFVRNGTNWNQQAYLKASNTGKFDRFGMSVAVSSHTVVVGAPLEDSDATGVNGDQNDNLARNAGAAYAFVRNGTVWSQQAYLKASNTDADDNFGWSVAVSGDTVVVGARLEDSNATGVNGDQTNNLAPNAGAAYIFVRSETNWTQQAYLKASLTGNCFWLGCSFGWSVAVSGDTVAVGAIAENSNATGVDGNQGDTNALWSGAAYIFVRNGTNWNQQAYLKASNTGIDDQFGWSVGVSGSTAVIGAHYEDSDATGVNGNQDNDSASNSGAAYVFTGLGFGTRLALGPDGSGGYLIHGKAIPDFTCRLERARRIDGAWTTVDSMVVPASGLVEFHDMNPLPGQGFYRICMVP